MRNIKQAFMTDLSVVLNEFSPSNSDNDMNDELLVEICNIAEEFFFYPSNSVERDELKSECVTGHISEMILDC